MKKEKSKKKTYAKPRVEELDDRRSRDLVGLGLFLCFCRRECFICEDETMLPQMMRDFWTSVGRRNIKCE